MGIQTGHIINGYMTITSKYDGYVKVNFKDVNDINKKPTNGESISIFVDHSNLHGALHGDTVEVEIVGENVDGGMYGIIKSIVKRGKYAYAGTIKMDHGAYFLVAQDKKMYVEIQIPNDKLNGAEDGDKVAVVIEEWNDYKRPPFGMVTQRLGRPGDNDAEMLAYALEKGFSNEYAADVIAESKEIKARGILEIDYQNRMDYRDVITFTIDPADAKDFDDAISYKVLDNGHLEVGVHIADVSYYVKTGDALDREAIERETSVYLVDRCIPMLPEILSNDLCSLVEGKDRLCMAAIFEVDKDGNVINKKYGRTVIKSSKRFSYEEAQDIMDAKQGLFCNELTELNRIAKIYTANRFASGALSLDSEEVKFKLDAQGVPVDVYVKERKDVHKMIEEWMLMANKNVSEYITKSANTAICIYRIHAKPDSDKMHDLELFIRTLGYKVRMIDGVIPSQDLNELLLKVTGQPVKDLLQVKIARSMQKAVYSTDNVGHYGLAFEFYSHFTSPIRRYPDVLTHRLLQRALDGHPALADEKSAMEKLCLMASSREKEATDAERGSIKYKQVQYMSMRLGAVMNGVVSGVSEWGLYVEEEHSKCEGFVRLRSLGDDFYNYNKVKGSIIGERTGEEFHIGDKLRIRVDNANLEMRQLDYSRVK